MIIAGEASGDLHGAKLAQSIKKQAVDAFIFGIGGSAMQKEGVRTFVDAEALSVVGITEVISKLPTIYRAMAAVKKALQRIKPDLLILIDFPDFNFHAAAAAKKLDIPVLYYISPQIWAWRQNRVKKIKRLVDHMAVILPFEASFYRRHQVPVTFVGHPLLDRIAPQPSRREVLADTAKPTIGLLPGSREKEVSTLLPIMLQAAQIVTRSLPATRFLVSCSESIREDQIIHLVRRYRSTLDIEMVRGGVEQVFARSRMLVAASGTVTLEAALYGLPLVIVYKVSPFSYLLGKWLIKVKYIGLVNLIVQKELMPELIQHDASPHTIARKVVHMVKSKNELRRIESQLPLVRRLLGGAGASDRVATIALDLIRRMRVDPSANLLSAK
jgi:lipid-A-disaccharide synthase